MDVVLCQAKRFLPKHIAKLVINSVTIKRESNLNPTITLDV